MKFVLVKFDSVLFNFVGERSTLKTPPHFISYPLTWRVPSVGPSLPSCKCCELMCAAAATMRFVAAITVATCWNCAAFVVGNRVALPGRRVQRTESHRTQLALRTPVVTMATNINWSTASTWASTPDCGPTPSTIATCSVDQWTSSIATTWPHRRAPQPMAARLWQKLAGIVTGEIAVYICQLPYQRVCVDAPPSDCNVRRWPQLPSGD